MQLHYKNYISSSILTAQNIPANQNIDFIKEQNLSATFEQLNTSPYILIDLQEQKYIRSCIVDVGNMLSTTTITLYSSNLADFSVKNTYSMTYTTSSFIWTSEEYDYSRYWKIEITDTQLNSIIIGQIFIGDYINLPPITEGSTLSYTTTSNRQISLSGQVYGNTGYRYFSTQFNFPVITEYQNTINDKIIASKQDILDAWNLVENNNPIWLVIWENCIDVYPPIYSIINQDSISFSKSAYYLSTSISFMEVK
jgi:hypothetical protein